MWASNALRFIDGAVVAPGRLELPVIRGRMIVLVHGYNNNKAQAEASYNAVTHMLPDADREAVWEFFWPGFIERLTGALTDTPLSLAVHRDERETESSYLISALSYHRQVDKSKEVGLALGQFLDSLRPAAIVFVAHSLGCRVTLEAIRFLVSSGATKRLALPGACLMAAAVPTYLVEAPSETEGGLRKAATAITRSFVLHSTNDRVLGFAFPLGQTRAGEGFLPEAVGFHGGPDTPWSARGDTGLGHSGYWTHPSTAPATLRAIGHACASSLVELQTLQRVTWRLSPALELPDRALNRRDWRPSGRRSVLA